MADDERYISGADNLSRLVRLETKVCLKFEELEKAIVLARDQIERDKNLARNQLDHRLEGMNAFQKRMDRLEGTFAVKASVDKDMDVLSKMIISNTKLIYIGIGIVLTLQLLFKFLIR